MHRSVRERGRDELKTSFTDWTCNCGDRWSFELKDQGLHEETKVHTRMHPPRTCQAEFADNKFSVQVSSRCKLRNRKHNFFILKAIGKGISLKIKSRSAPPATGLSLWSHAQDEHDDSKSKLIC
jgi:hypothetical protein